jgi:hypothetical protein
LFEPCLANKLSSLGKPLLGPSESEANGFSFGSPLGLDALSPVRLCRGQQADETETALGEFLELVGERSKSLEPVVDCVPIQAGGGW